VLTVLDKRENCCRNKKTRPPLQSAGGGPSKDLHYFLFTRVRGQPVPRCIEDPTQLDGWAADGSWLHLGLVWRAEQRCNMIGACSLAGRSVRILWKRTFDESLGHVEQAVAAQRE